MSTIFGRYTGAKIKGVTHCLLPDCEKIVWPFMNYCSKTHAQVGVQLGLIREYMNSRMPVFCDCTMCDCVCV